MKKLALSLSILAASAVSALAADLPAKVYTKAPPPPVVVYNWTGCYIGGFGGGVWVRKDWRLTTTQLIDGSHDADGGIGGGQGGCLYQTGNWVFGIQGDGGWTSASGSSIDQASLINQFDRSRVDSVYSVTRPRGLCHQYRHVLREGRRRLGARPL